MTTIANTATNVDGARELSVDGETAYDLPPPRDPPSFRTALTFLLETAAQQSLQAPSPLPPASTAIIAATAPLARCTALVHDVGQLANTHSRAALALEAEATWRYIDALACRGCELTRLQARDRQGRVIAVVVAAARRELEGRELAARETLQCSFLLALRLDGRDF